MRTHAIRARTGAVAILVVLALGAGLAGCSRPAEAMLDYDYSKWTRLDDQPITEPIPGHSSGVRTIYMNDTGRGVTVTDQSGRIVWDYPVGTVIIKEVAMETDAGTPGDPSMILGMIKEPDNPREQGGWLWIMRNPRSGEETVFDTEFCITCHADANERRTVEDTVPIGVPNPDREFRDYVFYPYHGEK
jgi:hypothetical protein